MDITFTIRNVKKKNQNNQGMSGIELLPLPRKAKTFLLPLTNKDDHQL